MQTDPETLRQKMRTSGSSPRREPPPATPLSVALLACLLIAVSATAGAQEASPSDSWRWSRFTTESGLPSNRVFSVLESSLGAVWTATDSGLAWFDGFEWHAVVDGPPGGNPFSMYADLHDTVWVVLERRLYRGDSSGFERVPIVWAGVDTPLSAAVPVEGDSVLVATYAPGASGSLLVYHRGEVTAYASPAPLAPVASAPIRKTASGHLWLNTIVGLYAWESGRWRLRHSVTGGSLWLSHLSEAEDGSGVMGVAFPREARGVWTWERGGAPERVRSEGANIVVALDISAHGEAVVVYETGDIRSRTGGRWGPGGVEPALPGVVYLGFRGNGDLWVGTAHGLYLHRRSSARWTVWRHPFPDARNRVSQLLRTGNGDLWIASGDGVERRRADGSTSWIREIDGRRLGLVTGLAEDSLGHVWLSSGADFEGAYRWDGTAWRHFGPADGLIAERVHKIVTDRAGRVWLLGISATGLRDGPGAFVYEAGRFSKFADGTVMLSGRVYDFAEGPDGSRWFGTTGGLNRWRDGQWTHWGAGQIAGQAVYALAVGPDGRVWFGDRFRGLGYIDDRDSVRILTTADGLIGDEVWDVEFDRLGCMWVTTTRGLSCFHDGVWTGFDSDEGLSNVFLWPVLPTDDRVYVGTGGGGVEALSRAEADLPPHRIRIEPPVVSDRSVLFEWTPLSYWGHVPSRGIETRYRVDDDAWSGWSATHSVRLEHLRSGRHTLLVEAKCLFGACGSRSRVVEFAIPLPLLLRPTVAFPIGGLVTALVLLGAVMARRRQRDSAALRESEQRFRTLMQTAPEAITVFDADTMRCVDANERALAMFGVARERLPELGLREVSAPVQPDGRSAADGIAEIVERTLTGNTAPFEWTIRSTGGEEIPCEIRMVSLFRDGRRLVRSSIVDVRDRKHAEEALEKSEHRFSKTFRASPEAMAISRLSDGRVVDVNDGFKRLTGYAQGEIVGRSIGDFGMLHPLADRPTASPESTGAGRAEPREVAVVHKSGDTRICVLSAELIELDGEPHVISFAIDITERKRAELALRASEEKFSKAFMVSPFALSISTLHEGRFIEVNDGFVDALGYSREELIGRAVGDLDMWVSDRSEFERELRRHGSIRGFEARLRTKAGKERDFVLSAGVIDWEDRPHIIAVTSDVTERRQSEQRRRELEGQLRQAQKMEALGTLAGGIAHDFNNILLAILGYAELLRDDLPTGTEQRESIDQVLVAGNRARDLVRQILAFSRQTESEFKSVDVGAVACEALGLLRTSLPSTIEIRTQIDSDVGPVLADASQIHQILLNLGSNAGHAMRDGGGVLTVSVEAAELDRETAQRIGPLTPGSYAALRVSDTGCGMDEATRRRVFDPFFTTKGVGEGTGLGLSAVHGIVTTHGGAIEVESAAGVGSTFSVYLPLLDDALPRPEHRPAVVPGGSERILFVDDEEQVALLGEQILNRLGYAATATTSSEDALARFRARPNGYDLLVVDNTMPRMTGLELARLCREVRPGLPIVLTSGNTENIPDEQVLKSGVAAVIPKPYSIQGLADTIRSVLERSETVRA